MTKNDLPRGLLEWVKQRCRRDVDPGPIAQAMITMWKSRGFTDVDIARFPQDWRVDE